MKKIILVIPLLLIQFQFIYSQDGPQTWTQDLSTSGPIWQASISISVSSPQTMYAASNTTGIWKSTNGGTSWAQMNTGLALLTLQNVAVSPSNPNFVYCGTGIGGATAGVYVSTDGGGSWTFRNTGIVDSAGTQQFIINPTDPNTALVAIWSASNFTNSINGVYKTTNAGVTWVPANTGMGANKNTICLASNPSNINTIYAGTSFLVPNPPGTGPTYIYKSYNFGTTWALVSTGLPTATTDLNAVRVISVSTADTSIAIAGIFQNTLTGGAFLTTNGGTSWVRTSNGIPNVVGVQIRSILIRPGSNTEFYAGLDGTGVIGVYRTTDAGQTWAAFNSGVMLGTYVIRTLAWRASDNTLFAGVAGTAGQGIYEYTFLPLGVSNNNGNVPKDFVLQQNYPNPFNPTTVIEYGVPKDAYVTVKVYDITGKEVAVLVNESKKAGNFVLNFNASNLPSGAYFYKIIAGEFTATKKMILVK